MITNLATVLTCHPLSAEYNSYVQTMFFSMYIHCIAADGLYRFWVNLLFTSVSHLATNGAHSVGVPLVSGEILLQEKNSASSRWVSYPGPCI